MISFEDFNKEFGDIIKKIGFSEPTVTNFDDPKSWQAKYVFDEIKLIADYDIAGIVAIYIVSAPEPPTAFVLSTLYNFITNKSYDSNVSNEEELKFLEDNLKLVKEMISIENRDDTRKKLKNYVNNYERKKYPDAFGHNE